MTLTFRDALAVTEILRAVQGGKKIAQLVAGGSIRVGTLRSVGDENGYFLGADEEVRDAYVRITWQNGFEQFVPFRDLMAEYNESTISLDYVPA
jgi:hypothetical protein